MWLDILLVLVAVLPLIRHSDAPSTTPGNIPDPLAEHPAIKPLVNLSAATAVLLHQEQEP